MNYCSLNDAWGNTDFISSQFKDYMNQNNSQPVNNSQIDNLQITNSQINNLQKPETFENIQKPQIKQTKQRKYEHFTDIEDMDCDDIINHVKKCRKCFKKLRSLMKSNPLEGIIDENREVIIMILIGISIMLFFNLVNNITK